MASLSAKKMAEEYKCLPKQSLTTALSFSTSPSLILVSFLLLLCGFVLCACLCVCPTNVVSRNLLLLMTKIRKNKRGRMCARTDDGFRLQLIFRRISAQTLHSDMCSIRNFAQNFTDIKTNRMQNGITNEDVCPHGRWISVPQNFAPARTRREIGARARGSGPTLARRPCPVFCPRTGCYYFLPE